MKSKKKTVNTAKVTFTDDEMMHLLCCVDYVREKFEDEGLELTSFGNPKILNRAAKKLQNTLIQIGYLVPKQPIKYE